MRRDVQPRRRLRRRRAARGRGARRSSVLRGLGRGAHRARAASCGSRAETPFEERVEWAARDRRSACSSPAAGRTCRPSSTPSPPATLDARVARRRLERRRRRGARARASGRRPDAWSSTTRELPDRAAFDAAVVDVAARARRRRGRPRRASCGCSRRRAPRRVSRCASSTSTPRSCPLSPACTRRRRRSTYGVRVAGCTVHFVDARHRHRADHRAGRRARAARATTRRRCGAASSPREHELLAARRCSGSPRGAGQGRAAGRAGGARPRARRGRARCARRRPGLRRGWRSTTTSSSSGPGIGALAAAALLARRSWRVLVLGQG